ncbi:Ubiquitin--protein ligase [Bertholletia excelsa]
MGDHLVLCVDHLITPESLQSLKEAKVSVTSEESSCSHVPDADPSTSTLDIKDVEHSGDDEQEPLIQMVECRICQEEDNIQNLEVPCACSGSLKFAHRKCVQRWCNEKGDITCEICHQPYQPGYTAPLPVPYSEDTTIDISGGWTISGTPLDLHDPRLLAMAAAERHLLETDYDEYADSNASGAAFCRSAALILMALLLLRHALSLGNDDDDDASTFFSLFLLRVAGFLLPCYIMAWAISILQHRRQRQEAAAALAATEVAFMVQAGQRRGLQFTVAPGPAVTPASAGTPGPVITPGPEMTAHQETVQ